MYLCCASPERFLRCDQNGNLEAKPIKGTIARVEPLGCAEDVKAALDLQTSVKTSRKFDDCGPLAKRFVVVVWCGHGESARFVED